MSAQFVGRVWAMLGRCMGVVPWWKGPRQRCRQRPRRHREGEQWRGATSVPVGGQQASRRIVQVPVGTITEHASKHSPALPGRRYSRMHLLVQYNHG